MPSSAAAPRHPKGPPITEVTSRAVPWMRGFVDSSVGAKVLVAFSGLGLVVYVVLHMIGNLKVFQGRDAINAYAYFLKHELGLLLWIARGGLLAIFVLHIVLAVRLKLRSVTARPVAYQHRRNITATTAGRTMIWTGIVVGLFTLFHLAHFTFGWVKTVETSPGVVRNYLELQDEKGRHDVYSMVVAGFTEPWLSALYIVAQLALFVHLMHGVQSAFQTLGLKNRRSGRAIWWLGFLIALSVLVGNLLIVVGVWTGWAPPVGNSMP
jgi:succinate dehydrogenase / fumarate reductase, cytochrome b subunit